MRLTNLTQVRNIQHETEKSSQQIIRTAHQLHKVLFVTVSRPATSVDVADLTVFHYSTPSHALRSSTQCFLSARQYSLV